ncbi:MAG: hypothetical protein ACR2QF_14930 [Geminicoccaceae bacterium]
MQFVRDGEVYKVFRTTGPTHNFLGLMFGGQKGSEFEVDVMDIKPGEPKDLDPADVKAQVCEGVDAASIAFGTTYRLKHIQFAPSDTPPAENYRALAMKVVERLAKNEPFTSMGN